MSGPLKHAGIAGAGGGDAGRTGRSEAEPRPPAGDAALDLGLPDASAAGQGVATCTAGAPGAGSGGQTTISPPANVKLAPGEPGRVLAWGVDTLVSSVDVTWESEEFFNVLGDLKAKAKSNNEEATGRITLGPDPKKDGTWLYTVKPHGADGYEWLLSSNALSASVGQWMEPKARPSMIFRLSSEVLWTHAPGACVDRVLQIIKAAHGRPEEPKTSRTDICVDVLIPEEPWCINLHDQFVCRAHDISIFTHRRKVSGFQIGKGDIVARLYDKPLEIKNQSNKLWMYDIWNVQSVSPGYRIVRIEFQLRRQAIKDLGLDTVAEVLASLARIWKYCTDDWLRIVDDPRKHHTTQTIEPWWTVVQRGVTGAPQAHPLVRAKAVAADRDALHAQLRGTVAAITALDRQGDLIGQDEVLDADSHVRLVVSQTMRQTSSDEEFTDKVKRNQARRTRDAEKFAKAQGMKSGRAVSRRRKPLERRQRPPHPTEGGAALENSTPAPAKGPP